ncbi:unnamed protein product [Arabis nemorensis]|uniref:Uncharacterized protein n=1 Tax=Arabis nemorensis TaxID=586526 RepID=A0A565AVE7_9BRAS|nr:unnamed protein product [Arabis nemorensis]
MTMEKKVSTSPFFVLFSYLFSQSDTNSRSLQSSIALVYPSRLRGKSGDEGGGFVIRTRWKIRNGLIGVVATAGPSQCEHVSSLNALLEKRDAKQAASLLLRYC